MENCGNQLQLVAAVFLLYGTLALVTKYILDFINLGTKGFDTIRLSTLVFDFTNIDTKVYDSVNFSNKQLSTTILG